MAVVRCGECKAYIPREDAIRVGIQSYCDSACQTAKRFKYKEAEKKSFQKRKRSPGETTYRRNRKIVLERDKYCRICRTTKDLQVHHCQPRSAGVDHQVSNLIVLCGGCHAVYAHGTESKKYRRLFRAYIWMRLVENRGATTLISHIEKDAASYLAN